MSRFCAHALCAVLFATPALAEPDADIVVVGQRDRPIEIAPRGLSVSLGEKQFEGVNAFNTEDLMKYAPNFFVRKRYIGDSNGVPGFRGTHSAQSARTLVMVDGFTVSNFLGNSFGFAPKWGVVGPGEVRQFDIVYGPYSSRYIGNSMGGIVNITTRDPERTEAFATVQGFIEPYRQFGTDAAYPGYSAEGGFGLKQQNGPWSVRVSARLLQNEGQPMSWYGLTPVTGNAPGTSVTGAIVDPGQAIAGSPGTAASPIFAAQSPARITQAQGKVRVGYDDGVVTMTGLFAYWHNTDSQYAPDCYLRDAGGNAVCEGRVTTLGQTWAAAGATLSRTVRDEYLAGVKFGVPLGPFAARLALSTYQIASSRTFTSNSYATGIANGAGTLADQGPTGWYTADLTLEHKGGANELAFGATANLYRTDLVRTNLPNWQSEAGGTFASRTYGKTRQVSAWVEDKVKLSPALSVTAGVRYDNWRAFGGGMGRVGTSGAAVYNVYADRSDDAVSPTLSAQLDLGNRTTAQLSLAMATRFPTVGELFQGSLNGDGSFNVNSFDPNLKPEKSEDANLLVAHDFGQVKLTASAFYQRVHDTIFSVTGFNQFGVVTSSFKNIDVTRQYGFELIGEAHLGALDVEANAAWNDSRTIRNAALPASEGVFFPRIPRWRLNGTLRYAVTPKLQGTLGARYASRPNTDLLGTQQGDTFGYTSELFALDTRVNWSATDHLRVSAGVDNITNDRAWVFHPYPQRTFLIEAGWRL
ncbi:MAG: TonB-dependent receptor [Pseudomonadota bacterium]